MKSFLLTNERQLDTCILLLRIGLGLVFVIGGWNKLYQLLDPALSDAILASYTGTKGYINQFFLDYLFTGVLGEILTPWSFLSILSAFELVSGLMLVLGFAIRPLSFIWAFLLWTFVFSLPVVTTPGAVSEATYTSPAMFVQVRDIALSGLFFILYNLGSGSFSIDAFRGSNPSVRAIASNHWNEMGLLLRVSLALPFLVAGFFYGLDNIQTFKLPAFISLVLGVGILAGLQTRVVGAAVVVAMLYFMLQKINFDKTLIANLNSFKREFAFLAAGIVFYHAGGGRYYVPFYKGDSTIVGVDNLEGSS
ncbi:MAG: DoxX family membrane protein [Cellvibrionaceae bacterium]|nr:DoxX family membrane protein [Cellvibrionaceae bacterium]